MLFDPLLCIQDAIFPPSLCFRVILLFVSSSSSFSSHQTPQCDEEHVNVSWCVCRWMAFRANTTMATLIKPQVRTKMLFLGCSNES